jgi:hypothetical protein
MTMIERVAREIEQAHCRTHTYESMAFAAIAAMREPTAEMTNSCEQCELGMWRAMIDAALKK